MSIRQTFTSPKKIKFTNSQKYIAATTAIVMMLASQVNGASFAGGTEIMFYGQGMSDTPQNFKIVFTSSQYSYTTSIPITSQSNAFNSQLMSGKLQYTTPSVPTIFNLPLNLFDSQDSLTFDMSLIDAPSSGSVNVLSCPSTSSANCRITVNRAYTPVLYYLTPRVVYDSSEVAFYVDPKSAQSYKISTENYFTEARINGQTIHFEDYLDTTTTITSNIKNQVKGMFYQGDANANAEVNFKFKAGNAMHEEGQALVCSYDNSTCYKSKVVPVIRSISASQGYTSGGQVITVQGYGFNSQNIQASIDGVTCTVKSFTQTQFTCETGANTNPSADTQYVGTPGLKRSFYTASGLNFDNLETTTPNKRLPQTSFELVQNQYNGASGNMIKGYFKAPATGNYRFYMACDDSCTLSLSTVNKDPTSKQTILTVSSYTTYRNYFAEVNNTRVSNWTYLEANGYYYIEAKHLQSSGSDHLTVSVETDANTMEGHQHSLREVQRIQIKPVLYRDIFRVWVYNASYCPIVYQILNPVTIKFYPTVSMAANQTAAEFRSTWEPYFLSQFGSKLEVNLTYYDKNGTITTGINNYKNEYYGIAQKSLAGASTRTISQQPQSGCNTTISFWGAWNLQLGSPPLRGSFRANCTLPDGTINQTQNILANSSLTNIRDKIVQGCPHLRDKIELYDGPEFPPDMYTDGRDIYIRYTGYNKNPDQLIIMDSPNDKLVPTMPINMTLYNTTTVPYSTNLIYEPIPFDFLHTAETKPILQVQVNNVPAVCGKTDLDCGYTYFAPTSIVTYFSLDQGTKTLTIRGDNLPYGTAIKSVSFGLNTCIVSASSDTEITCVLATTTTGDWKPVILDQYGMVPVNATLTETEIPLSVTDVNPKTALNPEGENILTITGTNFPPSLQDGSNFNITLSDGTKCHVISSTPTTLKCLTDAFSPYDNDTAYSISGQIWINNKTETTVNMTVAAAPATVTAVTPIIVSPVLKTNITLQLDTTFGGTLSKDDFVVKLIKIDDSTVVKEVNVFDVDNSAKTITIRYGGAYSGTYWVSVKSLTYGKFKTTDVFLTAIGKVTDFTPKSGSIYGGTLITITGYNFSTDILDNPVRIGLTDCLVESSSVYEITCRTQAKRIEAYYENTYVEPLIVFLKTSEEAVCDTGSNCDYTWLEDSSLPFINTYTISYNTDINEYQLVIDGSGFPTTTSDVTFKVEGVEQTVTQATDTQVIITLDNVPNVNSFNLELNFPTGTPAGFGQILSAGLALTPVVVSISPSTGAPGGTLVTAIVKGVDTTTTPVAIATSTGTSICSTLTIPSYGIVKCQIKAATYSTANILQVKVGTTTYYQCATNTSCSYITSTSMPAVTAISLSGSTLTLTGTNFLTSGYTGHVTYQGIAASTVTIVSATSVTATWSSGFPLSATAVSPVLWFEGSSDSHWATISSTIANSVTATAIASSVSCSFAGGCQISVTQSGLLSSLQNDKTKLTVCGQKASYSTDDSSSSSVVFTLPSLATTYSMNTYNLVSENYLTGTPFSSSTNAAQTAALFDGDNMNAFTDTSKNPCYVGTVFTTGHIGLLTEVKFFMKKFNSANYADLLTFQGSNDGTTYTDIFTVSNEIHEGWNYYSFDEGNELEYRYYRFYGTSGQACGLGEIGFRGVEVIADNNSQYSSCPIQLTVNDGTPITLTGTVTYSSTLTPLLTKIWPRYGKVQGGETLTFTGTNFLADTSKYAITLDGVDCPVSSATTTQVQCITGKRPGLYEDGPTINFFVTGKGNAATQDLTFRYANYWSLEETWGNEFIPMEGDTLYIPAGLHLLVDVDSTPLLQAVIVEGSLIFPPDDDPEHVRTFDAHYVMVQGGYLEIGTEEFPYTSKLVITMHGNKESAEIPIYGNKVIAIRHGVLEMHGNPRTPTWTELETTVQPGDTQITLHTSVDWVAGEVIVIAPTSYDNTEAEQRTISSIDNADPDHPVITLDSALEFKHYAAVETYGDDFIEMRAEVGLLTRNIIYRGDPETSSANQYGAHIMLHSHGDESVIGKIEYIEFTDVGQAFQLGRYPIHFHLIGTVHNSYIKGNSLHRTYNRAVTIHAVHYLRIIRNVAYNTMGHTFFIEDAIETKNYLEENLAIMTRASWSLLNTDQTPASFWITNPDNIFRGNHAAGADRYGFWFDTKPFPMGPSFTSTVCPENSQLGEFSNNVAHSNGRYGLRIFHKLSPRQKPCSPYVYDATNTTDPYWKNPLVTATFINVTSYKNGHNGAIALQVGDVRFVNFKVADNLLAGIEFELTSDVADGYAQINNALVIGHSENAEDITLASTFHGIITPRTENFQVHNANFFNFDLNDQAALGSCSHCFHPASTDSGARTVTFSNLYFDSSVSKKIRYQFPFRDIFYDLDGTLTGLGAKTWATPYFLHNDQPECSTDLDVYDGLICDSSIQVRRLAFYNAQPSSTFYNMEMKVLRWDDDLFTDMTDENKTAYIDDQAEYSIVAYKGMLDPSNSWTVPYVTGHKYKLHWRSGLDFDQMTVLISERWQEDDLNIYMVMNHTDVRQKVEVITGGDIIENETLTNKSESEWQTGDNIIYNDTETRQIHVIINGKNETRDSVKFVGYRCVYDCLGPTDDVPIEDTVRRWSNPESWTSGKVPILGEDVEIKSGWNMLFDVSETPIVNMVEINGRLTFEDGVKDLHLKAKYIFVRAGELIIGSEDTPFQNNAQITLYGEKENQYIVYTNAIEAGNKILANTNKVQMYGKPRDSITRLTQEAFTGDETIFVAPNLDWDEGDKIGLATTSVHFDHSEDAIIVSYNSATGETLLDRPLLNYHFGAENSTASIYGGILDIRGEVFLLNRNIKIVGEDVDAWGCQFVTSDFYEVSGQMRFGSTLIDNIEMLNCSQYDTYKAALRFEGALNSFSSVSNSVIKNGLGKAIQIRDSANILLQNNVVYNFAKIGINILTASNVTVDGNLIVDIHKREFMILLDMATELSGGIYSCAEDEGVGCSSISIINNIVAGTDFVGIAAMGHECGDDANNNFKDNVVHSIEGTGAIIYPDPNTGTQLGGCMEASRVYAYKNTVEGAVSFFEYSKIIYKDMIFVENGYGPTAQIGQEGDSLQMIMKNIKIYGQSASKDCQEENECETNWSKACISKIGMLLGYASTAGNEVLPKSTISLPMHKIMKDASWGGKINYENLEFIDFSSTTNYCGATITAIALNSEASDYQPLAKFKNTKFTNMHPDALAYLMSPPAGWANSDDCGNFPCTAPNNALLQFEGTTYAGPLYPNKTSKVFQITGNNPAAVKNFTSCQQATTWNAYYCENENLGILLFESLDDDKWRRAVSPISIVSSVVTSTNTLNTFMDHIWDGFYTGQLRMSRFPSIIQVGQTQKYDIKYSGTPPSNQRFTLIADLSGVQLRIDYTKPGAFIVLDSNKNVLTGNKWNDTLSAPAALKNSQCGEYRYVGVSNILEFYLTAGCTLYVKPIDSIQVSVRLDWTLDAFFASGGTTKFVDRLTAALGIHASNVKIVAVYQGSVIVNFTIAENGTSKTIGVSDVKSRLSNLIQTNSIDLGAKLLSSSLGDISGTSGGDGTNQNTDGTNNNGGNNGGKGNKNNIIVEDSDSDDNSNKKTMIIIVISVIIGLIVIGGISAYIIYSRYHRNKLMQKAPVVKPEPVNQSSNASHMPSAIHQTEDIYEQQYHPKAELGNIFGNRKAKIYEADSVVMHNLHDSNFNSPDRFSPDHHHPEDGVNKQLTQNIEEHVYEGTPLSQPNRKKERESKIPLKKKSTNTVMIDEEFGRYQGINPPKNF